ncbi:MAG TPA: hypothetical protein VLU25_09930 [Acidobacteriota bacterium]|nr:hypothetical protein [Acidobacteriota bacterium]
MIYPEPWIILRFRWRGPRLGLDVSTRSRRRARFVLGSEVEFYLEELSRLSQAEPLQWPDTTPPHAPLQGLDSLIQREVGEWSGVPALFVSPPPGWESTPWEALARHLCGAACPPPLRLSSAKREQRTELRLPLRLMGVDDEGGECLETIASQYWYGEEIANRGLQLLPSKRTQWRLDLQAGRCDILVLPRAELSDLRWINRLPLAQRPRLIICSPPPGLPWAGYHPSAHPGGCALLWQEPSLTAIPSLASAEIMEEIVHDHPLHVVLERLSSSLAAGWLLLADPFTNQGLRLRGAFRKLRRQGLSMEALLGGTQVESAPAKEEAEEPPPSGTRSREGEPPRPKRRSMGPSPQELQRKIRDAISAADGQIADILHDLKRSNRSRPSFDRESRGLVPLSRMVRDISRARTLRRLMEGAVAAVRSKRREGEAGAEGPEPAPPPPRRVDAGLERLDTKPLLSPVKENWSLEAGKRYQLRVHIGFPLQGSLFQDAPPAVDPLLPDPDEKGGHKLEITVQPKDFKLLSNPLRRAYLPSQGGTDPVYFTVRAPRRHGPAQLRICLYCRNHLLQSFLLHALTGKREAKQNPADGKNALRVELEHSATQRFEDLDSFKGRLLSIGSNQNDRDGSHELTVKGQAAAGNLSLLPMLHSGIVDELRKLLNEATADPNNQPRSYPVIAPGQPLSGEGAKVVRLLAEKGSQMFRKTFRQAGRDSSRLQEALRLVRQSSDQVLQVVRFDENFAIPWPVLYDYRIPRVASGDPPAPVCSGLVLKDGKAQPCGHDQQSRGTYCVRGFWGVRHRIEELIAGHERQRLEKVIRTQSKGAVRVAIDEKLSAAATLVADLKEALGEDMVEVGPLDDDLLLDLLWERDNRPAILIVLGHLEQRDLPGELPGPRIVLTRGKSWLREIDISDRVINDDHWDQPNTLVLLLACESAATDLKTLNDLLLAVDSARAGGIVGTEAKVGSTLAGQLAAELSSSLIKGNATLGQVLTDFRRKLLQSGNPLAFVFQCVGDADLKIVLGDS